MEGKKNTRFYITNYIYKKKIYIYTNYSHISTQLFLYYLLSYPLDRLEAREKTHRYICMYIPNENQEKYTDTQGSTHTTKLTQLYIHGANAVLYLSTSGRPTIGVCGTFSAEADRKR